MSKHGMRAHDLLSFSHSSTYLSVPLFRNAAAILHSTYCCCRQRLYGRMSESRYWRGHFAWQKRRSWYGIKPPKMSRVCIEKNPVWFALSRRADGLICYGFCFLFFLGLIVWSFIGAGLFGGSIPDPLFIFTRGLYLKTRDSDLSWGTSHVVWLIRVLFTRL